ncbi:DUF4097 domain-containing protein, partial [Planctomycetota bacterium]
MLLFSSCIMTGCLEQSEQFTKIVHMPVTALSPGSGFTTSTHNGLIEVRGSNVADCNVIATIVGRAATIEDAKEVVEETELGFEKSVEGLAFQIKTPQNLIGRSVSVSLDIVVPDNIDLELETHNGEINIENISGNTLAKTHNGKVNVKNISGVTRLETYNGRIESEEISGDFDFKSHNGQIESQEISGNIKFQTYNGSVKALFSGNARADCDIEMTTHNGSIELTTPPNYSARVNISTHNGSIDTNLPVTVSGRLSRNKLTGTVGAGLGMLNIETYNGSINIR